MSKQFKITLIIFAVIAVAIIGYFIWKKSKGTTTATGASKATGLSGNPPFYSAATITEVNTNHYDRWADVASSEYDGYLNQASSILGWDVRNNDSSKGQFNWYAILEWYKGMDLHPRHIVDIAKFKADILNFSKNATQHGWDKIKVGYMLK